MRRPALIFAINISYHIFATPLKCLAAEQSTISFWDKYGAGTVSSIAAAIIVGLILLAYKRQLRPFWDTLRSIYHLHSKLRTVNMRGFTRCREDYKQRRTGESITKYLCSARSSLKIVSFSLITAKQFEDFGNAIEQLVEQKPPVAVDISLLDPRRIELLRAIAPAYDISAEGLSHQIKAAMATLLAVQRRVKDDAKPYLRLYFHKVIPFASAILIDTDKPYGRIQIETKGYKSGIDKSWGFELGAGGTHPLYETLSTAFSELINDAERITEISEEMLGK